MQVYSYNLSGRKGLIVKIGENFGEIAPLPGFSKETYEEALSDLFGKQQLPSVRFGLECAKTALKTVDVPLAALRPRKGFTTLKLKLGALSLSDALDLTRKYLPYYRLRLDFNRKWPLQQAIDFTKHFQKEDFEYLEEPTKDLLIFSKETGFPIAVDESQNYDIPSLVAVVVKPTILGGIPKIPKHLKLILSSSHESGIGLLHIAKLAVDTPIGLDTVFTNDLLQSPIRAENGRFFWEKSPIDMSKLCAL